MTRQSAITTRALHGILAYRVGKNAPTHKILDCLRTVESGVEACWSTRAVGHMGIVARVEVTRAFSSDVWSEVGENGARYVRNEGAAWNCLDEVNLSECLYDSDVLESIELSRYWTCSWSSEPQKTSYPEIWGRALNVEAVWVSRSAPSRVKVIAKSVAKLRRVPLVEISRSMETWDIHDAIDDAIAKHKQAEPSINRPFETLAI